MPTYDSSVGWSCAETNATYWPYGSLQGSGSLPTIASNVIKFEYGQRHLAQPLGGVTTSATENCFYISSVDSDDWGGSAGDYERFWIGAGLVLYFQKVDATYWKLRVADNSGTLIATGTTSVAWATSGGPTLVILREATRVRIWLNGTLEIDASGIDSTAYQGPLSFLGPSNTYAGKYQYIGKILRMTDTSPFKIDESGVEYATVVGNADGSLTGFPTVYGGGTTVNSVDDWNGGAGDGDTTVIESGNTDGATYRHTFDCATPSITNPIGIRVIALVRVTVGSKNPTMFAVISDGTTPTDGTGQVLPTTTYASLNRHFTSGWGTMADLEIGAGITIAGGSNNGRISAVQGEFWGVTTTAVDSAARRRLLPQVA